jgi:hypothetical protein
MALIRSLTCSVDIQSKNCTLQVVKSQCRISNLSYLKVFARRSTARYAREAVDVRTAAKELGSRYVMEEVFARQAREFGLPPS